MGHLTDEDKQFLHELREKNILEEVEPNSLSLSHGAIVLTCADGDQFYDYYSHISSITKGQIAKSRVHTFALNGGSILLSSAWPDKEEAVVLKRHINVAVDLKDIHTVILYAHAPCGAAAMCHLNIKTVIDYLMEAKSIIKNLRTDIKVICFMHVDWDGEKKRTYFISRDKWEKFDK
ncbi:MAG: hypothetical protein WCT11_02620 [Candidatus Magasanikbacteria bacterium]|jgi:hypothetical protein